MSDTKRNPLWQRDETILALNLLLRSEGKVPDKNDERVIALSNLLRRNPTHGNFLGRETFRSPSAVALKLGNLQQEANGKGMPNNSQIDEDVWKEFGGRPSEVEALAAQIRLAIELGLDETFAAEDDDVEFHEGRTFTRVHTIRERNPGLRRKLLQERVKQDKLHCDICEAAYAHLLEPLRYSAFEAHHLVPLATTAPRKVRLQDLALLCAACHRLIHRLIADHKTWVSISQARTALRKV